MRILHVARQFFPSIGGVENFILCLAREQLRAGHDVQVLTLNRHFRDNNSFKRQENYEGIEINRIHFFGSKRYPLAFSSIKYLKNYHIIHIHNVDFFVDYLTLLKLIHRKKIVLHTHGGFFHTKRLMWFKKAYFNTITRITLQGCDKIIASSSNDYKLFSGISRKVVHIDNGVDIRKYGKVKKNVEKGLLLYVGRLDVHKRIDNLIRTVTILLKREIPVKLRIIGADWRHLRPVLEKLAMDSGVSHAVSFAGEVDDEQLLKEFGRAQLFVCASEYEGFGIAAVEAMASGTPCVLNDIPSFRKFVHGSGNGAIVNFENHEEASRVIENFISLLPSDYLLLSQRIREHAEIYSWEKVSLKIFSVYEDVMSISKS